MPIYNWEHEGDNHRRIAKAGLSIGILVSSGSLVLATLIDSDPTSHNIMKTGFSTGLLFTLQSLALLIERQRLSSDDVSQQLPHWFTDDLQVAGHEAIPDNQTHDFDGLILVREVEEFLQQEQS